MCFLRFVPCVFQSSMNGIVSPLISSIGTLFHPTLSRKDSNSRKVVVVQVVVHMGADREVSHRSEMRALRAIQTFR